MLWEQQDQQAYIHFPQILTETERLPNINKNEHRHLPYRDPTSFNTTYFEQINLDILKHQITDLILHLTFHLKQPQKNKTFMSYLIILDKIQYNQDKMTLSTFSKIKNLTN